MNRPQSYEPALRILIADDHDLIREGLRLVCGEAGIEIVGEAEDGESAIRLALELDVDVVLLDIGLPDQSGFDVLEHIKREKPSLPVLVYSAHEKSHFVERSVSLGAAGYLVKGVSNAELLTAIRTAQESQHIVRRINTLKNSSI